MLWRNLLLTPILTEDREKKKWLCAVLLYNWGAVLKMHIDGFANLSSFTANCVLFYTTAEHFWAFPTSCGFIWDDRTAAALGWETVGWWGSQPQSTLKIQLQNKSSYYSSNYCFSVIFQSNLSNLSWFQLLKCEDVLFLSRHLWEFIKSRWVFDCWSDKRSNLKTQRAFFC